MAWNGRKTAINQSQIWSTTLYYILITWRSPVRWKLRSPRSTDLVFITLKYLFLYTALQSYLRNSFRLKIRSIWLFCVNRELYFETYFCNSEESYTNRKHRTVRDFPTYEEFRTHLSRYQFQCIKLKVFQYTLRKLTYYWSKTEKRNCFLF